MLDWPDVKVPEAVNGKTPLSFHETLDEKAVKMKLLLLVGTSDHEIVAGDELKSPSSCITSVSGPFVYVAVAAIGKVLYWFHETLDEKVWACIQSTFVGVNDIVSDAELEVVLKENEGTTLEEP